MTESAAYGYRPAARPAGGQPRPTPHHLRVVPATATLQPETATRPATHADHVPAGQIVSDGANPGADGLQIAGWRRLYGRTRDYWTPPAVFTDQPASLAELADYARAAPWTQQNTGAARALGVGYYRLGAYPYTVWCRYREWVFQRPMRAAAHLGAIKVLALTTPGTWVVDHVIYPAVRIVGHILL